jgi:hypothetical protein
MTMLLKRSAKARASRTLWVTILLTLMLALPALGAGSAIFGPVTFTDKYTTPNYETPVTGTHSITSRVRNCSGGTEYYVQLVRVRTLWDVFYAKKGPLSCGTTYRTRSWTASEINNDTGTFHYDITKSGSGTTDGYYTWPS